MFSEIYEDLKPKKPRSNKKCDPFKGLPFFPLEGHFFGKPYINPSSPKKKKGKRRLNKSGAIIPANKRKSAPK